MQFGSSIVPGFNRAQALQADIDVHRSEFCANAEKELECLSRAFEVVKSAGPDGADEDTMFELQRRAHKLAGRGGTFGYHDVSSSARTLEHEMDRVIRSAEPIAPSDLEMIEAMIDAVTVAVRSMS